jgi:hypothetical protein
MNEETARSTCLKIVRLLCDEGYEVDVHADKVTDDSVVEHVISVDFEDADYCWNMSIYMNRISGPMTVGGAPMKVRGAGP